MGRTMTGSSRSGRMIWWAGGWVGSGVGWWAGCGVTVRGGLITSQEWEALANTQRWVYRERVFGYFHHLERQLGKNRLFECHGHIYVPI